MSFESLRFLFERRPEWTTPKRERPRCGAKTRAGRPCQAPAVWDNEGDRPATKRGRCRMHGGTSHGPTSESGKRRSLAALLAINEARREARGIRDTSLPPGQL